LASLLSSEHTTNASFHFVPFVYCIIVVLIILTLQFYNTSGPMVWYQKFEYAISHWLQKATEHMIGCVLCSPGCFSLFRASALMDDNVMGKYATMSSQAKHHVQYDQGTVVCV